MTAQDERAAVVAWLLHCADEHYERAENGKRYKAESRHHAEACKAIATAIKLGVHHVPRGDHITPGGGD